MSSKIKKLYRSRSDRVIGGIAGGLGKFFNVDPVLVRVVLLLLAILTAIIPLLIIYLIMLVIVPLEPARVAVSANHREAQSNEAEGLS